MNFRIETVSVTIQAGTTAGARTYTLPKGFILGANALVQSQLPSDVFLNVAIKDDTGTSINKASDIRIWNTKQCDFHNSYVPLNEQVNGLTYIFEVQTVSDRNGVQTKTTQDINVQFIMYYRNEKTTC